MSQESEKLSKLFAMKEEVDGFLSNLEQLKSDGSVTADMYSSLKSDYEQRRNAALSEIDRVKSGIKDLLTANERERDIQANELRKLEIRYKTGELTERGQMIIDRTPYGRFGSIEDLEGTTLFLANSKASGFLTGVCIPVDGGFLIDNI